MRKFQITILAVLAGAAALAIPAAAAPGDVKLMAMLGGASETPPTGSDATGMFMGHINAAAGQLCYTLISEKLDALTMAHIHVGAEGMAGPPVVVLSPSVPTETCVAVDKDLAAKIIAKPSDYYVNIHNTPFPKGAIRGQLSVQ